MTLLCSPVKKIPIFPEKADLFEIDEGARKVIYSLDGVAKYIDSDWTRAFPSTTLPVIISYHNFSYTPDLEPLIAELKRLHPRAHFYKVATMANSTSDSLRMLIAAATHKNLIAICMGELGAPTRICAPLVGASIAYAPLREVERNAPGQIAIDCLIDTYRFRSLNRRTTLFGLIGTPIDKSIGHLFHNRLFHAQGKNSLYIKTEITAGEVASFLAFAQKIPYSGLSVTAPLKELLFPWVDRLDPMAEKIGAVNTLKWEKGVIYGYNTDGAAAVGLLGELKNKKVAILGAGGTGRAVAYTALQRGAEVTIVARRSRAEPLARQFGCDWSSFLPYYDILVNATGSLFPLPAKLLIPEKIVFDLSIEKTPLLTAAQSIECRVIDGLAMFVAQALEQQRIWFSELTETVEAVR